MQTTFTIKKQPDSNLFECIDRRGLRCIFEVHNFESTAFYSFTKSVNPDKVKGMIEEMEAWLNKYQQALINPSKPLGEIIVATLVARRKELGYSQYKLADMMGVTAPCIAYFERQKDNKGINMATLEKMLKALDLNIVFL